MADIFLSYHSRDRARVARLADLLKAQGWSVWWDRALRAGEFWDDIIEHELAAARCVVVCWSARAVGSHWVREEASVGRKRGILVPVLLDPVEPPIGFQLIHALDLTGWAGSPRTSVARELLECVDDVLRLSEPAPVTTPPVRRSRGMHVIVVVCGLAGAALYVWPVPAPSQPPQSGTSGKTTTTTDDNSARSLHQPRRGEETGSPPSTRRERSGPGEATTRASKRKDRAAACSAQPSESRCEALPQCDWIAPAAAAAGAGAGSCQQQRP